MKQYVWQRQTYSDLAKKHNRSKRWVQRKLDDTEVRSIVKLNRQAVVIVADTTFFSRAKGLTVFRDPNLKKNIWWQSIIHERADVYLKGKQHVEKNGFTISAVVLDGRKGIREVFDGIPVQMCHFHQKQIMKRYLTTRPKLEASRKLLLITNQLTFTNEQKLTNEIQGWYDIMERFFKRKNY